MLSPVVIGSATLYLGKCEEILPELALDPAKTAMITDPPYGTGYVHQRKRDNWCKEREFKEIPNNRKPFDPRHLLSFGKVVLFGGNHFASRLPDSPCWLVWDKREGTTSDNQADCEIAWTNLSGPARFYSQLWRGICRRGEENISIGGGKLHPFQKPVSLMEWIINECDLAPGTVIVDAYAGSGSTGVAAARLGFPFIGIEMEEDWFDVKCRRLEKEHAQTRLF